MALDKQLNRNLLPLEMLIEQVAVPFQPVVLDASITATNQDKRFPGNGLNGIWNGLYDGHCIDMVRLAFMCHADTVVITWNGAFFEGEPDFCAKHQCRNSDAILECSKHEIALSEICQRPQSCIRLRLALKCWPHSCLYPKAEDVCDPSSFDWAGLRLSMDCATALLPNISEPREDDQIGVTWVASDIHG
ncbi:hypothetical protein HCBG_05230 [Histoplasma capsulatum G186AR]|uniref:Uncharacterized protein n=1 Tax=Ajellomyces capsulatus (strain G186AR / H82 / ATCC MYA-2454 / RMSCC 2432) TaxID=447093 RepID=C0NQ00_AJECG|nr:uncharacterized protein HCBG_05230 [Histoplasma capsulatum G186AR]EEH07010.1 hypothetical protein HCBG_05230 [Histoplasma capsulatum G186AR]